VVYSLNFSKERDLGRKGGGITQEWGGKGTKIRLSLKKGIHFD